MRLFEVKTRRRHENDSGKLVNITESYLFDAVSWTDAEARIYELMENLDPKFTPLSISPIMVEEILGENALNEITDEDTYSIRVEAYINDTKLNGTVLVKADSIQHAQGIALSKWKEYYARVKVLSSKETLIRGIFIKPADDESNN